MNIFKSIRSLFGFNAEVSEAPVDKLDTVLLQKFEIEEKIEKAQSEFDQIDTELSLKIAACDVLIEKGVKEGGDNKKFLVDRLDRITNSHLELIKGLIDQKKNIEQERVEIETQIITKAVEITSQLDQEDQWLVSNELNAWKDSGLIKGEQVNNQAKAITLVLEDIVKGGEGSGRRKLIGMRGKGTNQVSYHKDIDSGKYYRDPHFGGHEDLDNHKYHQEIDEKDVPKRDHNKAEIQKSHEPIAIELAGKGDIIYDSPVEGHYANVIVTKMFKEGDDKTVEKILFLKRAPHKVIAPNQYCLPGGHIDEGETIEQAASRELKEEANITADCYLIGKAKCDDGKWAFYLNAYPQFNDVALLDGENNNAHWMSKEEWIEADLIFDLKEHLVAILSKSRKVSDVPDIMRGEGDRIEKGEGLIKAMFHPEKPNHKYIRREGSEGNYTYLYDSPDKKSKDGKEHREGLYSSNQHPEHDKEAMEKIARNINAMDIEYEYIDGDRNRYNGWRDLDGKIRNVLNNTSQSQKKKLGEMVKPEKAKFFGLIDKEKDLEKAFDIDNPFYYNDEEELIKGRAAADGEERTWGGKKYKKSGGKWTLVGSGKKKEGHGPAGDLSKHSDDELHQALVQRLKNGMGSDHPESKHILKEIDSRAEKREKGGEEKKEKKLSTKQIKEHVENTSTEQLKKVAAKEDHPHSDAAKRELERRESGKKEGEDKEKKEDKPKEKKKYTEEELDDLIDSAEEVVADHKTYGGLFRMIDQMIKRNGEIDHFSSAGGSSYNDFKDSVSDNDYSTKDKFDEPEDIHIVFKNGKNIVIPQAPY